MMARFSMKINELKKIIFGNKFTLGMAIFLLFFFGLALVFWPILSGQKIFNDYYVTNYAVGQSGYNFYKDFGNSLKQGHLQLWWSSYMAGFPIYLTQVGFFNLLGIILFRFFDYILAYNWLAFLNFLFSGLAMYWFLRNLNLSISASILGGFSWALSFNNIQYGSMLIVGNVYYFIPLFFGALLKISNGKKIWWLFGGLISSWGIITGLINIVFYAFIIGFAWALFLDWPKLFGKTLRGYVFISFAGAILASIWLLPVFNYLPFTLRGEAVSSLIFYDYLKIGDVLRFFYPFIQLPGFSGFTLLSGVANLYIGIIPLFLAVIVMFLWRKNKFIAFWVAIFIFAFSMRLWFLPVFQWTQLLPIFNRFKGPFHWYSFAFFSLSVLSAYGLDYVNEIKNSQWFGNFIKILEVFAVLNIFVVLTANLVVKFFRVDILNIAFGYFDKNLYSSAKKYSVDYYHGIITQIFDKSTASFSFLNYQFLISFIFILVGVFVFILYFRNYLGFVKFKMVAVVITIFNLVLIWQGYYNFTPKELITNPPDTIKFIQNQPDYDKFRVFRFYPPEMYQEFGFYNIKNYQDYDMKTLGLQINPYWVDGFGGGEPFRSQRISEVLDEIGYEISATYSKPSWIKLNDLSLTDKISRFSSSHNQGILSMLNIKYIFSSFKLPNFKLVYETTATEKNIPIYVYENPEAMPRIYFANDVKFVDPNNAFDELLKVKDFRGMILIECQKECSASSQGQATDSIKTEEFRSEFVKIKTKSNQARWLVYSDANLPTWKAYIDNQKIDIYTANYLFKSIFVPKGEHEVVFKYPDLWGQFKYAVKNIF